MNSIRRVPGQVDRGAMQMHMQGGHENLCSELGTSGR